MSYKFKGQKVIINGIEQTIIPGILPNSPNNGYYAIDSTDNKLKVWNSIKNRWIILGDAEDQVFNNDANNFEATNTQTAIEEARDTLIGKIFNLQFSENATLGNEYMETEYGIDGGATNHILPFNCKLVAMTFSNQNTGVDVDLRVVKIPYNQTPSNSLVPIVFQLRNTRNAAWSDFSNITFNAGDKIAVYADDQGDNASEAVTNLFFQVIDNTQQNLNDNSSGNLSGSGGLLGIIITL